MFEQVKIILVETTHPGNIGAVARAIKNMGFAHLGLVSPHSFPSEEATARAGGAACILEQAVITQSLEEAVSDCHSVWGVSARERRLSLPILSARQAAETLAKTLQAQPSLKVGLVFGPEHSGLSNEALQKCQYQIQIPANPLYSSLNLSQAVQILSYELRMAFLALLSDPLESRESTPLATAAQLEHYYLRLESLLTEVELLDKAQPRQLMAHLRRLYGKQSLTQVEINLLQGILTAIEKKL